MLARHKSAVLLVLATSVLALTAGAQAASATELRAPKDDSKLVTATPALFDWAWSENELGTSLWFSKSPSDTLENWNSSATKVTKSFDGPSSTRLKLRGFLTPGKWYWRTCTETVFSKENECDFDAEIWSFNLTREMSLRQARRSAKAEVKEQYGARSVKVTGCHRFKTNKFDCSGRFLTAKLKCSFAAVVDNTGESVWVALFGLNCDPR